MRRYQARCVRDESRCCLPRRRRMTLVQVRCEKDLGVRKRPYVGAHRLLRCGFQTSPMLDVSGPSVRTPQRTEALTAEYRTGGDEVVDRHRAVGLRNRNRRGRGVGGRGRRRNRGRTPVRRRRPGRGGHTPQDMRVQVGLQRPDALCSESSLYYVAEFLFVFDFFFVFVFSHFCRRGCVGEVSLRGAYGAPWGSEGRRGESPRRPGGTPLTGAVELRRHLRLRWGCQPRPVPVSSGPALVKRMSLPTAGAVRTPGRNSG